MGSVDRVLIMEGCGYSRMEIMEDMEEFSDDVIEDEEYSEERNLIEEDEDYLMNLERYRIKKVKERLKETSWEPSLIVCWTIVFIVPVYVIFLIITGGRQNDLVRDEL